MFNNIFHDFKVLKKFIITKTFNVDFHNKFIKFWIILFFNFSSYCRCYFLYIYLFSKKDEFCLKSWQDETLFTVALFSKKSIVLSPFMSQDTVNIAFFTDHCTWNFFFNGESVCFHSVD